MTNPTTEPKTQPEIQLFAQQKKIYPQAVRGRYRKLKWGITMVLLGIFYLSPWLRWDRGANTPNQAILIDMMHARAYFFGIEIWSQEVYYITGILILAAVGCFLLPHYLGACGADILARKRCGRIYLCWWSVKFKGIAMLVKGWMPAP